MQVTAGDVLVSAQTGLRLAYKQKNLILACQYVPDHDVSVKLPDGGGLDTRAIVASKEMLNTTVMRIELTPEGGFVCEPGQYLTLINNDGLARSYSVANDPCRDGRIELHIRLLRDGLMSNFLKEKIKLGDSLTVRGPAGHCFYVAEEGSDYPIVLAGTGTGLAPLYGIAKQALAKGHRGEIQLFHGALDEADLYLIPQLRKLGADFHNFHYAPCVLRGESDRFYRQGNIQDIVMSALPIEKSRTRLFLCGAPEMVNALKRKAFLGGLASKHIFADAFLPTKTATIAA